MSKLIFIYGAGGLGREIKAMLLQLPEWHLAGFYDDALAVGSVCEGISCLGGLSELKQLKENINLILAFGSPLLKEKSVRVLRHNKLIKFPSLIHPTATLLDPTSIRIGAGSIITAGVILTTNITIGEHVLLNLNATVGHDTNIGDYSSVMPGVNLAGEVVVEEQALIGSGANILNRKRVGRNSRVGAGAVVLRDVPANSTAIGVPAHLMKEV